MKLDKALEDKMMDLRLVDRFIQEGKLTKAQLDEYLANLEDDSSKMTYVSKVEKEEE